MKLAIFICLSSAMFKFVSLERQDYAPVLYGVEGEPMSLPCAHPSAADFLKWIFKGNGSEFSEEDAAQVFPGQMPSVFFPFNVPPGRSELEGGVLKINQIMVADEGHYWCEISSAGVATTKSDMYPVHVYVTPEEPKVSSLAGTGNTLTEYKKSTVARCTSLGGKPGAKITWMNGTEPLSTSNEIMYRVNPFKNYLTDANADLRINSPTRYDHKRVFLCIIEHPAYKEKKVLNYSINVMYHPIKIRVWVNLTSLYVYCEAEGYPDPTYYWRLPGGLSGFIGPSLYIANLYDLPGNGRFECVASNGVPPNTTLRVQVDELLYPDGKPGWLGLEWWIWGVILGGVLALTLIVVVIAVCCCHRRRGKASKKEKFAKQTATVKKSILKNPECTRSTQQPTSLGIDMSHRTPDGREDSFDYRAPSPVNQHKQALIEGVVDRSMDHPAGYRDYNHRHSNENMCAQNRMSMRSSVDQLDAVANHIQTLNKSWDQLSKSRQMLNDAQDELQHVHPNRDQSYHSYSDRNDEYYAEHNSRSQDQHDEYMRQPPPAYGYDERDCTYNDKNQSLNERYCSDQGCDGDRRQEAYDTHRDDRYYDGYRDEGDRGDSYNGRPQDSRYDDGSYDYRYNRRDYHQDNRY